MRFSAVVLSACLSAIAAMGTAQAQKAEPITLGLLGSVTGGGAAIGRSLDLGVRLAVHEINSAGGILGRPIEVVTGDTHSDPTIASTEARRLVFQEKVNVLFGPLISTEIAPTLPVTTSAKILQFTSGSAVELSPEVGPYHFAVSSTAVGQGTVMVNFAASTLKAKSVAILADNGGQSKSATGPMEKRIADLGMTLAGEQEYQYRTDDMTPQLLSLRRANPDVILFLSSSLEDTAKALSTLRDIGWKPKVVGGVSVAIFAPNIAKMLGADVFQDVYGESFSGTSYCSSDKVGAGDFARFKEALRAFSPSDDGKVPVQTALYFYDGVYFMKAAVEGAGTFDAQRVSEWIEMNAGKVKLITTQPIASKESHHLFADRLVIVEKPQEVRSDDLQKRAGC